MLRFSLRQVELKALGRFCVPLPKLTAAQGRFLARHMEERGLGVRARNRPASKRGGQRVTLEPAGLAWSDGDLLDAIGPAIPELLSFPKEESRVNPYFAVKRSPTSSHAQLFPRMEAGRTWSALRADGACGLTPDEGSMIRQLLRGVGGETQCVSGRPREGSSRTQVGKAQYFQSTLPVAELASSLRIMELNPAGDAYLPKSATLRFETGMLSAPPMDGGLGEWCYLVSPGAKTSN